VLRILVPLLLALASGAGQTDRAAPPASQPTTTTSAPAGFRFAEEIRRFAEWDRRNSFPKDAVLFVGSSSIRMWATRESFTQWPIINRGFGGSTVAEVNQAFDQVVLPYRAKVIVLYAGDNDIASGITPEQVRDDFAAFVRQVRQAQPDTPVVFLSIKPSASRWARWPAMQEANALIRTLCASQPHLTYVDVATPLLGDDGQPRAELFLPDRLHLSAAGYAEWTRIVTPIVEKLLQR
jgi:lysophospholipase L1-like esterase